MVFLIHTELRCTVNHASEWLRLVTYLITYVTNDRLDTKCMEPAVAVLSTLPVHQFTSCPHWSQFSSNSMPDRCRWRALVNAVMKIREIWLGESRLASQGFCSMEFRRRVTDSRSSTRNFGRPWPISCATLRYGLAREIFPKRGKKYEDTFTRIVMKELKNFWILAQMFGVYTVRLNLGHFIWQLSVVTFSRLYEGKVTATCSPLSVNHRISVEQIKFYHMSPKRPVSGKKNLSSSTRAVDRTKCESRRLNGIALTVGQSITVDISVKTKAIGRLQMYATISRIQAVNFVGYQLLR